MFHPSQARQGFTLVESLVALALVLVALLMGLSVFWQQPRVLRRIEAHREALSAVEATLETLRSGARPLRSGEVEWPFSTPPAAPTAGMRILVDVAPTDTRDLYEVTVRVLYRVENRLRNRTLTTLVWSP